MGEACHWSAHHELAQFNLKQETWAIVGKLLQAQGPQGHSQEQQVKLILSLSLKPFSYLLPTKKII